MPGVFISYARKDARELALFLARELRRRLYRVWLDVDSIPLTSTWSRAIEEAIADCDTLLAILTTGAAKSDICRGEQLSALRLGKRVLPLLGQTGAAPPIFLEGRQWLDFSDSSFPAEQLNALLAELQGPASGAALREEFAATFNNAPPPPQVFVQRSAEFEALRDALLGENTSRQLALTALHGMGGIGKTVLAQALCHDKLVQSAFPDGVVWLSIGSTPDLVNTIRIASQALGDSNESHLSNLQTAQSSLRNLVRDRAVLFVLDDVWDALPVDLFRIASTRTRTLFTTRDQSIGLRMGAESIQVTALERGQAVILLRQWAQRDDAGLEALADRLGCHPLALSLAGGQLRRGITADAWIRLHETVSQIRSQHGARSRHDSLKACFDVSLETVEQDVRRRYLQLGVFPPDCPIPAMTIGRLWDLSEVDSHDLLGYLCDLSLLEQHGNNLYALHDLLRGYCRELLGQESALHARLIDSNKDSLDEYFFRNAAYHYRGAGREAEFRRLISDYPWIRDKIGATDIVSVIADYGGFSDMLLIQEALQLSSHVLASDAGQLPSQLLGRLSATKNPSVQHLLRQCLTETTGFWLRPLSASLTPPGGSLVRTLAGHSEAVRCVAFTPDSRSVVSASADGTLKVWDLPSGAELRTLVGHTGAVYAVAVMPGHIAVSASADGTLKVWDLASGAQTRTLVGHQGPVLAVAVSRDGRRAISASFDNTLRLWDIGEGREILVLAGHRNWARSVAFSHDGAYAVSASADETLKVWDLSRGSEKRTLYGHSNGVSSVAVTADDRHIVSASWDQTLSIWDFESGALLRTLTGHTDSAITVAVTADGRRALSGGADGTVRIWDVSTGAELRTLFGHADSVFSVATTADGLIGVSASADATVRVWDLSTQGCNDEFRSHAGAVASVAVSASGVYAVSASADETLRLWGLPDGSEVRTFASHEGPVSGAVFTPNSNEAPPQTDEM